MPWYEKWFDRDEYELVYHNRDAGEAEEVIDLLEWVVAPPPGTAILDVGCGRGRHSITLARRGYRVSGVDLSERALGTARKRATRDGLDIAFLQGDMREPVCHACFDGLINLFTAFGYFEDEDDHLKALQAMAAALKPGGWLFQDFLNAPYVHRTLIPEDRRTEKNVEIIQRRWIEEGRINKEILFRRNGNTHRFCESVRLFTLEDFEGLYAAAGLTIEQTFGSYDGLPSSPEAPRLILLARKT